MTLNPPRQRGFHLPALGTLLAQLGGIALTIATSPEILASAAGKLGVSTAVVGAVVGAVLKPIQKSKH